mgnify:CR=1 FL=1
MFNNGIGWAGLGVCISVDSLYNTIQYSYT